MPRPPFPRNEEPPSLELNHRRLAHVALLHDALRRPVFVVDDGPDQHLLIRRPKPSRCACTCVEQCANRLGGIAMAPGSRQKHVSEFERQGRGRRRVSVAWRQRGLAGSEGAERNQADEAGLWFLVAVLWHVGGIQDFVDRVSDAVDFVFSVLVWDGEEVLQGLLGVFESA
jgi:hypothetical protein